LTPVGGDCASFLSVPKPVGGSAILNYALIGADESVRDRLEHSHGLRPL
jgi:hypothetical protein